MRLFGLFLILLTAFIGIPSAHADLNAESSNEREIAAIFWKHAKAFEQLSRHHLHGQAYTEAPLPNQKNVASSAGQAHRAEHTTPQTFVRPEATEYTFSSNNVWANLTIHVTDNHGSFRVVGESDASVSGWVLQNKAKSEIAKGRVDEQRTFAFNINDRFSDDLELTVYVTKDAFTNPAYIPLHK